MKPVLFLLALVLLAAGLLGFERQAAVATLPPDLEIPAGAFPVTLEGVRADGPAALDFLVEGYPVGRPLELASLDGTLRVALIPVRTYDSAYMAVTLVSGLFFWVMATLVFLPRLDRPAVPQFFFITLLYGTGILVGGVYFQTSLAIRGLLLSLAQISTLALLPVVFLHLALVFPVAQPLLGWRPRAPWPLYGLALAVVAWQSLAFVRHFQNPGPAAWSALAAPNLAADVLMVIQAALGIFLLVRQERTLGPCPQRQQVRWLLLGFVLGATPYVFLRTLPQLLDLPAPFPAYLDRIFEPAIPLAFVFAIVRYRFLNIDIILRRGLLYGILAAVGVLLVLLPVATVSPGWTHRWSLLEKLLPVAGGLVAGLFFQPLRQILGGWIDRTFFKIGHRLGSLAREMEAGLAGDSSQEEVLDRLLATVNQGLDPESLAVGLTRGSERFTRGEGVPPDCPGSWLAAAVGERGEVRVLAASEATTSTAVEVPDFPNQLTRRGWALVVPLLVEDTPRGALYLGPKRTGHRYVGTEVTYAAAAAAAASRRLSEIGLVQKVVEERLARQQLDELGRLKDDFLSRVAHDLRTPVTSLSWSLRNLLDGLAGDLQPRQAEYLEAMNQAVTHLDSLVAGLLEISRLEKTEAELALEPVALGEVVDRSLGTVQPLAAARGITLSKDLPPGVPAAMAHPDKLAEVLVNLLSNAVRYSPDGNQVDLAGACSGGRISLTVRDHGPGFSGISDPFARFAQGTPSPHGGGGYGLGLTIAHEYMSLMGGSITACNHPQGGAEFTLELEAAAAKQEGKSHGT